jgi:hypothetical protein
MPPYTFTKSGDNVQVTDPTGNVVGTGTPGYASTYGYVPPPSTTVPSTTSSPSVLSSQAGADLITKKNQQLTKIAPPTPTVTPTKGADMPKASAPAQTSITLINPDTEQSVTFNDASLNRDRIQSYMTSGYKLAEANGSIPSWLSPDGVSTTQSASERAKSEADTAAAELKSLTDGLSKFTVSDADLAGQISGITAQWDARISDMAKINEQRKGSINTLGIRIGSRYAGGSGGTFGGIVSEEERQGVQRIGELEGQKQAAIAAARTAALTQNWTVFNKQVDIAQKAYEQKANAVKDLQKATADQNKLIADTLRDNQKAYYDQFEKPLNDILSSVIKNGAPKEVQDMITNAEDIPSALAAAGTYLQDVPTSGIVGEYLFYKKQAEAAGQVAMDFNGYQDMDVNRRKSIAAAGVVTDSGLNPRQVAVFNSIVDKQNSSPLIAANDRAVVLKNVTSTLEKDPKNAALQVAFIYSMIQALDTYQSAVREGEIALLSSTQGLGEKIQNLPQKIQSGTPLAVSKINEYISVSKMLTDSINEAAQKKRDGYSAQARVAGIGPAFEEYQSVVSSLDTKNPIVAEDEAHKAIVQYGIDNPTSREQITSLAGEIQPDLGRAYTWQEIQQILGIK